MTRTVDIELITPKIAGELLEQNTNNRYLSEDRAKQYADDMNSGEWKENSATIGIAKNGVLTDGQTRLRAIELSGKSQKMIVVRGLEEDSIQTTDIGKKRTNGDMLEINGYKNKTNLSSAASICLDFSGGEYFPKKSVRTPTKILNYVKKNPRLYLILNNHMRLQSNKKVRAMISVSLLTALHHQLAIAHKSEADLFIDSFLNGEGLSVTDPAKVFRERLQKLSRHIHRERGHLWRREIVYYGTECFNAFVAGKKMNTELKFDPAKPPAKIKRG